MSQFSVTKMPVTKSPADAAAQPSAEATTKQTSPAPANKPRHGWLTWLGRTLPTVAVIAALGGLGFWGHRTGWKLPTFAELAGTAQSAADDWCEEHGVPESQCVNCNPDAFPKPNDYGWCKEHGVHNCPLHHPDVAQVEPRPSVEQADLQRAERALKLRPRPENNFACTNPGRRIQFASREAVAKAGVDVELVERAPITESIAATGEIRYDETRVARLSSKSAGTLWRVDKQIGERTRRGDVLALIDATEVGRLKSQLLAALAQEKLQQQLRDRLVGLAEKQIVSGRQLQEAEAELSKARTQVVTAEQALTNLGLPVDVDDLRGLTDREAASRLRFLGLPASIAEHLDPAIGTSNLLPVTAPLEGIVASRNAVAGEVVDSAKVLFEVVDTRQMWLMLNVPMEEAKYVGLGQEVEFQGDDAGEKIVGEITWISTTAEERTRTIQVRADLPNPDGRLRNETFGLGNIVLRTETDAITVPNEAVQWDGSCQVVFVRDKDYFEKGAPKVFHTRSVRVGAKTERYTEIIAGVLPGEVVAAKGANVLRAQLLKNNLGAG